MRADTLEVIQKNQKVTTPVYLIQGNYWSWVPCTKFGEIWVSKAAPRFHDLLRKGVKRNYSSDIVVSCRYSIVAHRSSELTLNQGNLKACALPQRFRMARQKPACRFVTQAHLSGEPIFLFLSCWHYHRCPPFTLFAHEELNREGAVSSPPLVILKAACQDTKVMVKEVGDE